MSTKRCFVIIGYGKKTSYANGKQRQLDLDQTYTILIKPVFEALKIDCYRAIDKNLTGSIDKFMLDEIREADIAVVDLSTLNANVMWELGVRHALKQQYTIMICEKEQMSAIPFDVNSFVVHQYVHSEEGIPYVEVDRFRKVLTAVVDGITKQDPPGIDSPVFTFLPVSTQSTNYLEQIKSIASFPKNVQTLTNEKASDYDVSFASVMQQAEDAKNNCQYEKALLLLASAKKFATENMTLRDNLNWIICRQALNTYKLAVPNPLDAYKKARAILQEVDPKNSQDLEVLGLSGAVNKRLFELTQDMECLDAAILFYEKGFLSRQDYYNGINAAFMLYQKASLLKSTGKDWGDTKLKADYTCSIVLDIALKLENDETKEVYWGSFTPKVDDKVWVILTIAEVYHYKNNPEQMLAYEQKAMGLEKNNKNSFAIISYLEQKAKIEKIFQILN